jgi:hypothetical protein
VCQREGLTQAEMPTSGGQTSWAFHQTPAGSAPANSADFAVRGAHYEEGGERRQGGAEKKVQLSSFSYLLITKLRYGQDVTPPWAGGAASNFFATALGCPPPGGRRRRRWRLPPRHSLPRRKQSHDLAAGGGTAGTSKRPGVQVPCHSPRSCRAPRAERDWPTIGSGVNPGAQRGRAPQSGQAPCNTACGRPKSSGRPQRPGLLPLA